LHCMLWAERRALGRRRTAEVPAMARWPRHAWTTLFTYAAVFVLFPLLCWLAYAWVRGALP